MSDLFSTLQLGDLALRNRIAMAPLTRNRADMEGIPTAMMATYYGQRAEAGLIISESVPVSAQAIGYPMTPGLFDAAQVTGWRAVTDAVHERGGHIFAQLQHCGRISHPSMQPNGETPVAPSPIQPQGAAVTYTGMQPFVAPRALLSNEISGVVDQFTSAARYARMAGFDGVEVHGANGYLIDQFLRDGSNHRSDAYGGSPARRLTLLIEIVDAVSDVFPRNRIGVRLSPENSFNDMHDSDPAAHFTYFVNELSRCGLACLHVLEGDMASSTQALNYRELRRAFGGTYIANNGYDHQRAMQAVADGDADIVAFGASFLANPDLVERLRENHRLNTPDPSTFYTGGERGHIDYPAYTPA